MARTFAFQSLSYAKRACFPLCLATEQTAVTPSSSLWHGLITYGMAWPASLLTGKPILLYPEIKHSLLPIHSVMPFCFESALTLLVNNHPLLSYVSALLFCVLSGMAIKGNWLASGAFLAHALCLFYTGDVTA